MGCGFDDSIVANIDKGLAVGVVSGCEDLDAAGSGTSGAGLCTSRFEGTKCLTGIEGVGGFIEAKSYVADMGERRPESSPEAVEGVKTAIR